MIGRKRQVSVAWDWTDGDALLQEMRYSVRVAPGSRARAMPCVWCQELIAGEQAVMVILISGSVCELSGQHFNGAGFFRHERCHPDSHAGLLRAAMAALDCVAQ